ncbi:MAG: methylated-DNA--[protein]-cysteine S-methyltransferase [Candidatus Eisenbacteria bacterium]|nr:methylated-DNA--[protein]-cysteine S-methyltransferase [Candidatus Eisenbacteria bacterium]
MTTETVTLETATFDTPLGSLTVFARSGALCAVGFTARRAEMIEALTKRFGPLDLREAADPAGAASALRAYAAGRLDALDTVQLDAGGTAFQRSVWNALRAIPAGTVTTYAEIARAIGHPTAVRAAGAANGANPIAIVVPCHRVIGSDGSLHGYAGGLDLKRRLIEHERVNIGARIEHEPARRPTSTEATG